MILCGNPGLAGGGGLIRNDKGEWIKGFAYAIGTVTSIVAEFWALKDGIRLCITLKLPMVVIELDSKLVVDLLKKELNNPNDNDVLVADCRNSLRIIPTVRIRHCYREENKCADHRDGNFAPSRLTRPSPLRLVRVFPAPQRWWGGDGVRF